MRDCERGRPGIDAPFPCCGVSDRQILAEQYSRRRVLRQVAEHHALGMHDLRVRPVIPDAVAETVLQLVVQIGVPSIVILRPMPGLRLHPAITVLRKPEAKSAPTHSRSMASRAQSASRKAKVRAG